MTNCNVTPAKVQKVENAEEAGGDVALGVAGILDKKDFRELTETPKLLPKPTRCVRADVQKQLLSLMQLEDDYLDLTFQSMAKKNKR